jgi:large subunit ribosomal protein L28
VSRKCELTGVKVMYGNKVSHSERKTRRRFEPNLHAVKFFSHLTGTQYKFRVNAKCIRSVDKAGGFDEYILSIAERILSPRAKIIKRKLVEVKQEAQNEK